MTATPANQLLSQLCQSFPNLDQLVQELQTSQSQLQQLSQTAEVSISLQTTLQLATIRFQFLAAQLADAALTTLSRLLNSDKPEVARRAANTLLTLAGLLPTKSPGAATPQKPWDKTTLTKQHMPTYNNSTPVEKPDLVKPAASGGVGHGTPEPATPPIPTKPTTEVPIKRPIPPTNDQGLMTRDSFLTKQHLPTYDHSPIASPSPRRPLHSKVLQQAISQAAPGFL